MYQLALIKFFASHSSDLWVDDGSSGRCKRLSAGAEEMAFEGRDKGLKINHYDLHNYY